jgi:hypothetical protein
VLSGHRFGVFMRIGSTLITILSMTACGKDLVENDAPRIGADLVDEALARCVNRHLNFSAESRVTLEIAATLIHLDCIDEGISSLEGLEVYTGLKTISLWENNITDISPLASLSQLEWLELGANEIEDLHALSALEQLTRLGVSSNEITDISALSKLSELQWLMLDDNQISDVSALEGLENITWLTIEHNDVEDQDVLDSIADNGADVYAQHQADGASGPPIGDTMGTFDPTLGTFISTVQEDGTLQLDLAVAGNMYAIQSEISGDLKVHGEDIVLYQGNKAIVVGQTDGATASLCTDASVCAIGIGIKLAPASAYDGLAPAPVISLTLGVHARPEPDSDGDEVYGESNEELIEYVLASPNQFDAGSCLFMTTTGAMELLVHQHTDLDEVDYDGDTDLSERFLMAAYQDVPSSVMRYWLTDIMYTYNHVGGSMLNRDYPFTAGYVRETSSGNLEPCDASDSGAYYSCSYNWFDERPNDWEEQLVDMPSVERTVAFTDPSRSSSSQWNVALMDDEDVDKIKYLLRSRRAPVVIIYNHYLYWHADLIVGYDDSVQTNGCPMVESSMEYFDEQGSSTYTNKIERHMDDIGPCTDDGIFYVRDSIYDGGESEIDYQYGGFTDKYSQRIIERSYNWVKYLGNHAYAIHRK